MTTTIKAEKNHEDIRRCLEFSMLLQLLQYLHEDLDKPILHRNIKPSNVMVADDNYVLQLSDFGVSK